MASIFFCLHFTVQLSCVFLQLYWPTSQSTMSVTRLAVRFEVGTVLDLDAIHDSLCRSYKIGYVGLYDCGTHGAVYIQTSTSNARMTQGKVFKICKQHGEVIGEPATFKHRDGTLVSDVGQFRKSGTHTSSTDSTVTDSATDIYLSIHPVGEEDLSHISLEQFKSIFGGSKEELHRHMRSQYASDNAYQNAIENSWQAVRSVLFQEHCEKYHGLPVTGQAEHSEAEQGEAEQGEAEQGEAEQAEESSDGDKISVEYPINPPEVVAQAQLDGQPLYYDSREDSDYNRRARERVAAITMLDRYAADKSLDLPHLFGELLFANPHNVNVCYTKKSGSFEFFDGQIWRSENVAKLHIVTKNWIVKIREFYHLLEERHGEDWTDSFHGLLAWKSIDMLHFWHPDCANKIRSKRARGKADALRVIHMANTRVRHVTSKTGKRVRRVLCDTDFEVKGKKILRRATWSDLESGVLPT